MYFLNYAYMCLVIGTYLYFQLTDTPIPDLFRQANTYACWAFLIWGGFLAGRIIVDCISMSAQGEMTAANVRNGIMLAILHFLPSLLMSIFLLKEGFMD